jgi:hypothetical protein
LIIGKILNRGVLVTICKNPLDKRIGFLRVLVDAEGAINYASLASVIYERRTSQIWKPCVNGICGIQPTVESTSAVYRLWDIGGNAMVALRDGFFTRRAGSSQRATDAAFKVGDRVFKKKGGASQGLREAVRLYRESQKSE